MTDRKVVAQSGSVGLAEALGADEAVVGVIQAAFDVDADPRPFPMPVHSHTLTVLEAGDLAGGVSWMPVLHGPQYPCLAWVIGVTLMPEHRGRGVGTVAHRLLVDHLFASTDLDRVEAETDVDNLAERRVLEKVGFACEGILRGAQLRGGVRRDLALYGLLRP
ncbi:MAG: GNAT family N-acetyltransferase [Acidimicrobiales bacterium]